MNKNKIIEQVVLKIIKNKIKTYKKLDKVKRRACADFGVDMFKNAELLAVYQKLLKKGVVKKDKDLEKLIKKRSIRTMSGVAPIAVLTKPFPCPGKCAFCPTENLVPKSYLSNEPAVMRAIRTKYDPYTQVMVRLRALRDNGHDTDKIELIVMGGTWSCLPNKYKYWYIKRCFEACNHGLTGKKKKFKTLKDAQKYNEQAKHRIVGLTLETRPDYINEKEIIQMRKLGCTRVEIGVQSIYDDVLKLNNRGHDRQTIINATKLLKQAGFKISYHMMPNLPGSTVKRDFEMFKELFANSDFAPDMLKIYPCVVVKGAKIYNWWKAGKYKPYTDKQLFKLLLDIKKIVPRYVRITRLIRDIPKESIEAGNIISNLREMLQKELFIQGKYCKCIRCLEARGKKVDITKAKFRKIKYTASQGTEYFLYYSSPDNKILYAFLRLRINNDKVNFIKELGNAAIIREVHTYGQLAPLKHKKNKLVQHAGFGKRLMEHAEEIIKKQNINKIAVISGVGVRKYYEKLGYTKKGTYMLK